MDKDLTLIVERYFRRAPRILELIESSKAELRQLQEAANLKSSLGNVDRARGSSDGRGFTAMSDKRVDLERKICKEISELYVAWNEIHDIIQALPDQEERLVLRYRYIHTPQLNVDEISDKMRLSRSSVWRIYNSAIIHSYPRVCGEREKEAHNETD